MIITIFGATGFIGKELVQSLVENNYPVNIVTRNTIKAKTLFSQSVKVYDFSYNTLLELINKSNTIINLAGENISSGLWTKSQKQKIITSRVNTGNLITQLCVKAANKPGILIQASAIGYYGYNINSTCNEESSKGTGFLSDVCEQWENSTRDVVNYGINRIIIRTGVVFGKNGGILPKLLKPFRYNIGAIIGRGQNYISWIHIQDEIRAIEFLIKNQHLSGAFNLTAPTPVKMEEIIENISRKYNKPILFSIQERVLRFFLGDLAKEMLLASQQVLPDKLMNEGFRFNFETMDSALTDLLN